MSLCGSLSSLLHQRPKRGVIQIVDMGYVGKRKGKQALAMKSRNGETDCQRRAI